MAINEEELKAKQAELEKQIEEAKAKLAQTREEIEAFRAEKQAELDELQLRVAEIQAQPVEEEAPAEEPVKKEKVLKPAFDKVLEIALGLQEDDWKVNNKYNEETKTGVVKFNKGKVQFLILQATSSDYRITFLSRQEAWSQLLTSSKAINIPKNAKGDKWLRLVNKGTVEASLVRNVLKESVKGAAEEIDRIAREKEEAKAAKKAAKKAEREKAKAEESAPEAAE